jgi:hypothetical protein
VEETLSAGLTISAAWENQSEGTREERATFGLLEIVAHDVLLTEGQDSFVNRLRNGPYVSNYHCAEWLAWNWWRLRWEGRSQSSEWALSHRMSSIGAGYVWPNLTIFSDGERVVLVAKPSSQGKEAPFRYIKDTAVVVRAVEFEGAVDAYVEQVISQLRAEGVEAANLDLIWSELLEERRDPSLAQRRRFEALLGCDPGEADSEKLEGLVADARELGEDASGEIAAHSAMTGRLRRAADFKDIVKTAGFAAKAKDAVRLSAVAELPAVGFAPAWKRGAAAAVALRLQERLEGRPIDDRKLEELAGVSGGAIEGRERRDNDMSFALDDAMVFRAGWKTGRRFELARLLGDRIAMPQAGRLRAATSAYTYRQRMQRSFAAEFLCPYESLSEVLAGDYSAEAIEDASHIFEVSERVVRTLLVNHGCLERDQLMGDDWDGEIAA